MNYNVDLQPESYKEYELQVGLSKETWKKFQRFCDNSTKVTIQVNQTFC